MKNQMTNANEGTQAQVNNRSIAMQLAELESQMEQEAIKEQLLLADLECQAEQGGKRRVKGCVRRQTL